MSKKGILSKFFLSSRTLGTPMPGGVDVIFIEKVAFIVYIIVSLITFLVGGKKEGWSAILGGALMLAQFTTSALIIWYAISGPKIKFHYFPLVFIKFLVFISLCGWILYRRLALPIGFLVGISIIFISVTIAGIVSAASLGRETKHEPETPDKPQFAGKQRKFFEGEK